MIKVADAGVVCCNPVFAWERNVEDIVHVLVDCEIGVEEDTGFVGGKFKSPQLSPGVFEAGCYEGDWACRQ